MLRSTPELEALDRRWAREHAGPADYAAALRLFTAMWVHARDLGAESPTRHWRRALAPDLAIARAINGLSPDA